MNTNLVVEFIIWLLIAASVIAVIAARLRIPYTVALVLGGLALGAIHIPFLQNITGQRPDWLTPDVALIIFLPPLLFEGSVKIQLKHLRDNLIPILLLANVGVLVATVITGYVVHWEVGLPILAALLFGSIISATDPISVISIFKDLAVNKRLSIIVEGESLFNDGTAAVLFGILLAGFSAGRLSVSAGIAKFLVVVLGGAAVGLGLGYIASKITQQIDEPRIEITLTTVLAYTAYLAANSLHLSGVIATVAAGLTIGNFGVRIGMSPRTRVAMWSFWEYFSFVINSIVFLLIGLEVRLTDLLHVWPATLLAIGAVLLGRALSVYAVSPVNNAFSEKIPFRWQHVMVWGGMHGALSLALALSLPPTFPYREQILAMTFGAVAFTIVVQGLTIKSLLRFLGIATSKEDDYERARVRQIAIGSARAELDSMVRGHLISYPIYERFHHELQGQLEQVKSEIVEIYRKDETRASEEIRLATLRLVTAEKSSIEQAMRDGIISSLSAKNMIDTAERALDQLNDPEAKLKE
ncbi:MAG TPA: Na+/H+ antiporter [Terriglobia bacterium]|nr:Na+/H+ antiporter [Terriglobia bacterium]